MHTTMSMGETPMAFSSRMCPASPLLASIAANRFECRVFTRPSSASERPIASPRLLTSTPASLSAV